MLKKRLQSEVNRIQLLGTQYSLGNKFEKVPSTKSTLLTSSNLILVFMRRREGPLTLKIWWPQTLYLNCICSFSTLTFFYGLLVYAIDLRNVTWNYVQDVPFLIIAPLQKFDEIDSDDGISQDKLLSLTLTTEAGEEEGERETTTSLLPIF